MAPKRVNETESASSKDREAIARVVAKAPPLTAEQREQIARIINGA
ncbi:hypothetical protein [Microbacterium hydrocarbonoxydans]|nr:hypothetical protein [Microbacterium hydrocarbonoxydans]MCM3780650.1 hypothetical protein [Microbacterium hydrocarbonoxydans]